MKTNKKEFKLICINGYLYFAVKAGSARAAKDYIYNHIPQKVLRTLLISYFGDYNSDADDAYNKLYYDNCFMRFKEYNEYYMTVIWEDIDMRVKFLIKQGLYRDIDDIITKIIEPRDA